MTKIFVRIICAHLEILSLSTLFKEATMQGKVEICGVNTSKLKVLSQKEMDQLLRRSKQGDEGARQELIEGNLRLVLSVIQRFDKRGESPDDLFQVGCIGLIKAISNFDPDKQSLFYSRFRPEGISIVLLQFCFEMQITKLLVQKLLKN